MRRLLPVLIVTIAFAGCAAMTVSSHIERNVNFTEYVTYDWGPPDNLPVGDPRLDNNPFFRDYLMGAVEKKLATFANRVSLVLGLLNNRLRRPMRVVSIL